MPLAGAVYTKKKQLYKEEVVIRKKDSYTEKKQKEKIYEPNRQHHCAGL